MARRRAADAGGAAPVVYQQGTYAPDSTCRWMGSAAPDKTGGLAIGYNVSEYLPANGTYNRTTYIYSFKLSTCQ